jgi:glucose-6-phosphate isomerase
MKTSLKHSVLPKRRLTAFGEKLRSYTDGIVARIGKKNLYEVPESSLLVSGDVSHQRSIEKEIQRLRGAEHVILIGIGGSNLGTEAVYHALKTEKSGELTVLDQIDRESLENLTKLVKREKNPKKLVLVVVSKSGATTETMLNAVKALEICEKRYGEEFKKQVIFIGDRDSTFLDIGRRRGVTCIPMPAIIGGRYSVFTAVGIVPLTLLGIDTGEFRRGAREALRGSNLRATREAGATLALHALGGVHTVNFFTFGKRLEVLGFWYRQLLAESIGKNMTTKGASFSHQLLPIVSTAVDLHSMAQLFLSGYEGMYTHFLYAEDPKPYRLLSSHWLLEHVPFLRGKRVGEVSQAIVTGVMRAYDGEKLPYRKTELESVSAYEVGLLMSSLMCEVMCIAHVLGVDAFNQPEVELYKKHTRSILNS